MTLLSKQLLILSIVLLVLFLASLGIMVYHRIFKRVVVKEGRYKNAGFIYEKHTGDYQNNMIILETLIEKVKEQKIPVTKAATIYYDNPRKKSRKELRSDVGLIVHDSAMHNINTSLPYKIIGGATYLMAEFPYVSRFSIMIGAMKVYPAFKKRLKKLSRPEGPMIEIYDFDHKRITYLMPI